MKPNQKLASSAKAQLGTQSSFASTQAAWRFYANGKTTLSTIAAPLLASSCEGIERHCDEYALIIHDWSSLNYYKHNGKHDKKILHNSYEQGYELQSSIAISDRNGMPIGVLAQNLATKDGVWSTYQGDNLQAEEVHLDELSRRVQWLENLQITKRKVSIVDREADSVAWMRANAERCWLIRCRKNSSVNYNGKRYQLKKLAGELDYSSELIEVQYNAKKAYQSTASVEVDVVRPALFQRKNEKRRLETYDNALKVRFVVSRVVDADGRCLAEWYLLTNVFEVFASTIARWYYWRWKIESFFKLLKQQGLQIEEWQQESGLAIAKRLLVASQACVLAWQLRHDETTEALETQVFLVRLSGRQMKRKEPITNSALFDGIWLFLTMMDMLEQYTTPQLIKFKQVILSFWEPSPKLV